MSDIIKPPKIHRSTDEVLQEMWRIKDELSSARGHDVHRLFAEARERQKHSGHPVVDLSKKPEPEQPPEKSA